MVTVNGAARNAAGTVLLDYLTGAGYSLGRIAVARNGEIVPRARYGQTVLEDGDTVEIVSFVGGG
ncbi:MAG: sulfur carrier protein ThiS [Oscillospiraceae bacterium]|nr:sulfur carrier protein ThiS [Oscillospiraceae bacterium]